jgi:hypothetical protein
MLGLVLHATHWEWEFLTRLDLDDRWLDVLLLLYLSNT